MHDQKQTEIADGSSCIKTNMINDRDLPFAYLDLRCIAFSLGNTNSLRGMSCTEYGEGRWYVHSRIES